MKRKCLGCSTEVPQDLGKWSNGGMIKMESVWEAEGSMWERWDSYSDRAGTGKVLVSSGITATHGSFGQASWTAREGRERGLSPSTCFSPFDLLYPAPMVHGWDRGCNGLCGHHRTARQLLPALGTPTASFTYTMYHGQLSYCAAGTPSEDHSDCSEYHGIHGFLPFSS